MLKDLFFFILLILNKYLLLYLAKKLKKMYPGYSRTLRAKKTDKKLVKKEENKWEEAKDFMWFQNWELTQEITQESRKISDIRALNVEVQYSFFILYCTIFNKYFVLIIATTNKWSSHRFCTD